MGAMTTVKASLPQYYDLLRPTLQAVIELGGSARLGEIDRAVVEIENYSDAQQRVLHADGPKTEIGYRLAWARTHLKRMGLVENSDRGVWSVTDEGRDASNDDFTERFASYRRQVRGRGRQELHDDAAADPGNGAGSEDWKEELLDLLLKAPADRFERLARRLLLEAGFVNTTVTGKSGDGGIDGVGTYRVSLISFNLYFQCKRYAGSVGAGAVRDFRGAMAGRGDRGLLITTGTFTGDAKREATRDGAPPLDLVDGQDLCELLKQYGLGVRTRQVEEVELDRAYFDEV